MCEEYRRVYGLRREGMTWGDGIGGEESGFSVRGWTRAIVREKFLFFSFRAYKTVAAATSVVQQSYATRDTLYFFLDFLFYFFNPPGIDFYD